MGNLLGFGALAFFSIILTMHYHLEPDISTVYGPYFTRAAASRQQKCRTSVVQNYPKSEDESEVNTLENRLNAVEDKLAVMEEKYKILKEAAVNKHNT